jgi:hypothetical protein
VTLCSSEYVGQVKGSFMASGGFGPGDGFPRTTTARRAGHYVAPAVMTGETREFQALLEDLAPVESTRWRRRSGRGAVWPSSTRDRECGVFRGGMKPAKAVASYLLR